MRLLLALIAILWSSNSFGNIVGNSSDVVKQAKPGLMLAGGGDVTEAFEWMIERSGGGDFLVIGSTRYSEYIYGLGGIDSVESIIIDSKEQANSDEIEKKIKSAEAIFIAGGNQREYLINWEGTKLQKALNSMIGKIPLGGNSAGMAIMGEYYYGASLENYLSSSEALSNPYIDNNLGNNFLSCDCLTNIITDTHYSQRNREGRHVAFMARLIEGKEKVRGIGIDEHTALCIDESGSGRVFGEGSVYFLEATQAPECCEQAKPLEWDQEGKAVKACIVRGSNKGELSFCLKKWEAIRAILQYWSVKNGKLKKTELG